MFLSFILLYIFLSHHPPFSSLLFLHLISISIILFFPSFCSPLIFPPFRMPTPGPVRTPARLSASLNTHHSLRFIVRPDSFCSWEKKATSPLLVSLLNSLNHPPPRFSSLLPSHFYSPRTVGPHDQWSTQTRTFHKRKGQRVQLPQ